MQEIKITKVYSVAHGSGVDSIIMLINDPTRITTETHWEDGRAEVCASEREPSPHFS